MNKYVNVEKIITDMEKEKGWCFTSIERTLLEIAVLKGTMAMLEYERKEIKELKELRELRETCKNLV